MRGLLLAVVESLTSQNGPDDITTMHVIYHALTWHPSYAEDNEVRPGQDPLPALSLWFARQEPVDPHLDKLRTNAENITKRLDLI